MKKRGAEDFIVLTKTYDLLLWYVQQIGRFPRQHRYSLGVRIEKHLYRVMEWLTIARYQRENRRQLEKSICEWRCCGFRLGWRRICKS